MTLCGRCGQEALCTARIHPLRDVEADHPTASAINRGQLKGHDPAFDEPSGMMRYQADR
jgi:hypothetical protein